MLLVYQIDPAASQVRFELDEDLRGQRTTVIGVTHQVAGAANATISRADYQLTIPPVRNVANVEDEVELYIDFVANATS